MCQDLVRHYGTKCVKPICIMKLDMEKAYDTIDWGFLKEMLKKLNFPNSFINRVMTCVQTLKFSIMVNGSLHGFFWLSKGFEARGSYVHLAFCCLYGVFV